MPYPELHRFIILFGALTSFILGLSQLFLVKKNRRNYLIVLVFFDNALFQISNEFFIFRDCPTGTSCSHSPTSSRRPWCMPYCP